MAFPIDSATQDHVREGLSDDLHANTISAHDTMMRRFHMWDWGKEPADYTVVVGDVLPAQPSSGAFLPLCGMLLLNSWLNSSGALIRSFLYQFF